MQKVFIGVSTVFAMPSAVTWPVVHLDSVANAWKEYFGAHAIVILMIKGSPLSLVTT